MYLNEQFFSEQKKILEKNQFTKRSESKQKSSKQNIYFDLQNENQWQNHYLYIRKNVIQTKWNEKEKYGMDHVEWNEYKIY